MYNKNVLPDRSQNHYLCEACGSCRTVSLAQNNFVVMPSARYVRFVAIILASAFVLSCSTPKEGLSLREIIEVRAQAGAASTYQNQAVREVRELQQMTVRLDDMLSLLRQRGKQIERVSKVCITTQ